MHKINISIDDVSPHPRSSIKVLDRCFEIIEEFPKAKFSLFVPIAYWRTVKRSVATQQPLVISQYPEFCNYIKKLPKNNFEICYHGLYHGIPGKSDNDEFQYLNYDQAKNVFNTMFEIVKLADMNDCFKKIFRPPAWRMSPGSIQAARDAGIEVLALSSVDYAKKVYAGEELKKKDVVYSTCCPPFDELSLTHKTELVYHACEWDKNYLSKELSRQLSEFLSMQSDYEFCFMSSLI